MDEFLSFINSIWPWSTLPLNLSWKWVASEPIFWISPFHSLILATNFSSSGERLASIWMSTAPRFTPVFITFLPPIATFTGFLKSRWLQLNFLRKLLSWNCWPFLITLRLTLAGWSRRTFTGSCSGSESCGRPASYTKKYVDFEKFRAFQQKGGEGNLTRTRLGIREGKFGIIPSSKATLERKSSEFF